MDCSQAAVVIRCIIKPIIMNPQEEKIMQEATDYLLTKIRYKITIAQLAAKLVVSESNLKRLFREKHGKGVYEYFKCIKIEYSKNLLQSGATVKETGLETGYDYTSNFVKAFKDIEGMTPTNWLRQVKSVMEINQCEKEDQ